MLQISEELLSDFKSIKYRIYSLSPLKEGIECFNSYKNFKTDEKFLVTTVEAKNIKSCDGKFYYTNEDLSADWFPSHIVNLNKNFKKCHSKPAKYASRIPDNVGKIISGYSCIVDTSELPAFKGVNEDKSVYEYRFYLTLFNKYTVKQLQYERHDLFDAKFESSKFDLISKMQNTDFLKEKDFVFINYKRQESENVVIGTVLKEGAGKYSLEYGTVYIDMTNKLSIKWN
jgi:hypothetical protein